MPQDPLIRFQGIPLFDTWGNLLAVSIALLTTIITIHYTYFRKQGAPKILKIGVKEVRRLSDIFIDIAPSSVLPSLREQMYVLYEIQNLGSQPIRESDFRQNLTIANGAKSEVLKCHVQKKPKGARITVRKAKDKLYLSKFLLNPSDIFRIEALVLNFDFQPKTSGRILGVPEINLKSERIFSGNFPYIFFTLMSANSLAMLHFIRTGYYLLALIPVAALLIGVISISPLRNDVYRKYVFSRPPYWKFAARHWWGKIFLLMAGPLAYEQERYERYDLASKSPILEKFTKPKK